MVDFSKHNFDNISCEIEVLLLYVDISRCVFTNIFDNINSRIFS